MSHRRRRPSLAVAPGGPSCAPSGAPSSADGYRSHSTTLPLTPLAKARFRRTCRSCASRTERMPKRSGKSFVEPEGPGPECRRSATRVERCPGRSERSNGSKRLGTTVSGVPGGFPACMRSTVRYRPSQRSISESTVDLPVASAPTKAITAPPSPSVSPFRVPPARFICCEPRRLPANVVPSSEKQCELRERCVLQGHPQNEDHELSSLARDIDGARSADVCQEHLLER